MPQARRRATARYIRSQKQMIPTGDNHANDRSSYSGENTKYAGRNRGGSKSAGGVDKGDARDDRRVSGSNGAREGKNARSAQRASGAALSSGERTAYRMGYLDGIADAAAQLESRRIRIAARSVDIETPSEWPQRGSP